MKRDNLTHLSLDELLWLAAGGVERRIGVDGDAVNAHLEGCVGCRSRLRGRRSVAEGLANLANALPAEVSGHCPSVGTWASLGDFSSRAVADLLEHASSCDHCGPLLRATADDPTDAFPPAEGTPINGLASSHPDWQARLAGRLASESEAASDSFADHEGPPVGQQVPSHWALAAVLTFAVVATALLWVLRSPPSLASTNQVVLAAYTHQRPFPFRLPDAQYGPLRQHRGSRGAIDESQAFLDAQLAIARRLEAHPTDTPWLEARGRVNLLEGKWQEAIEALQRCGPAGRSVAVEMAIAYAERAEALNNPADSETALRLLGHVLAIDPRDPVALFNRALLYTRTRQPDNADKDWERYLAVEPRGDWADEAKKWKELNATGPG